MERLPFKRRHRGVIPIQVRAADVVPVWDEFGGVFTQETIRSSDRKRVRPNCKFFN